MGIAEWKCLGLLDEHGPSTATQLAKMSGFTSGATTGIVDQSEMAMPGARNIQAIAAA
jgi:DNA-binding MarR family transcriptional regulator